MPEESWFQSLVPTPGNTFLIFQQVSLQVLCCLLAKRPGVKSKIQQKSAGCEEGGRGPSGYRRKCNTTPEEGGKRQEAEGRFEH